MIPLTETGETDADDSVTVMSKRLFHSLRPLGKNPYYFYDLAKKQPRQSFDPGHYSFGNLASTEERARQVFGDLGSRDASRMDALHKARTIAGVRVPEKPEEPTNCCMSGCVNCVWEMYKDDLEDWRAKRKEAKHRLLTDPKYASTKWPSDFGPEPPSRSIETNISEEAGELPLDDDEAWDGVDVNIKVFVETEKRLHALRRQRAATSSASL
ncbi:hypothetical protein AWJ20_4052 [Sugiyamaella lignohabitans]|uniref:Oxidoreductase-like domain-containing protein n=1 Tax=Sugiyamaella lignohabitans TaxID=796027 RepID=A0A167C5N2_9ASCO|nr:uncharacterized protein AWJ20_4052 [Sugiyamaella lignohabitans]ANB11249.1 hypothetical protein AWJ20_4052 [Sugiyamaella lignohabitans]